MRCYRCGWVVDRGRCPCEASSGRSSSVMLPVGTRVVARPGRGPSMDVWMAGEVTGHCGNLHSVRTRNGEYWCEQDDILADSSERLGELVDGARVWALWLDGRWYTGQIDGIQGPLRHVTWDDGDSMWLDPSQIVMLAAESGIPEVGQIVVAPRWDGEQQAARVEQQEEDRFRVLFRDGEEAWVSEEELTTFPPNPFLS